MALWLDELKLNLRELYTITERLYDVLDRAKAWQPGEEGNRSAPTDDSRQQPGPSPKRVRRMSFTQSQM